MQRDPVIPGELANEGGEGGGRRWHGGDEVGDVHCWVGRRGLVQYA